MRNTAMENARSMSKLESITLSEAAEIMKCDALERIADILEKQNAGTKMKLDTTLGNVDEFAGKVAKKITTYYVNSSNKDY